MVADAVETRAPMAMDERAGLYVIYLKGAASFTFGALLLERGRLLGGDTGGSTFRGGYSASPDGNSWAVTATAIVPPNVPLVPGFRTRPEPFLAVFSTTIPKVMANGERTEAILQTPDGDLVLIIVKVADLPSSDDRVSGPKTIPMT
jgi:hypothetical protein